MESYFKEQNSGLVEVLDSKNLSAFDLIPQRDLREKLVELVLNGVPKFADYESSILFRQLYRNLTETQVDNVKVVVFGGGTGLSNIIGGDCRQKGWVSRPFYGLKALFPETRAVVCVTDDGGSTGEILKDLPVIAIGDIRHVLLSSVQVNRLCDCYDLSTVEAEEVAHVLADVFNFRFSDSPDSTTMLLDSCPADFNRLPSGLAHYIRHAIERCFVNERSRTIFKRPHCLGNIIVLSAFLEAVPELVSGGPDFILDQAQAERVLNKLSECAQLLGAPSDAVLPSTLTPAQLRFLYTNGVQVTGEHKSSTATRGYPVESVVVDFCHVPQLPERVLTSIEAADILIMAPGSLYSSIIPVLQVPGIADAVRSNTKALKLLISNLWVQAGETDLSVSDPERKFHVSDMIRAYERNLPGGTRGLFDQILCLSLKDVPGSVLQNYAIEGKIPIYLDREMLEKKGFEMIECGFFSKASLLERQVIQHDPDVVAKTVKTLYLARELLPHLFKKRRGDGSESNNKQLIASRKIDLSSIRYQNLANRLSSIEILYDGEPIGSRESVGIRSSLVDIVWKHQDIPLSHFDTIDGINCITPEKWRRDQRWDNVFSFYNPDDRQVTIRRDRLEEQRALETAFLIALGQSLLGNYAQRKTVEEVAHGAISPGRVFNLYLTETPLRKCYFSMEELRQYLALARMVWQGGNHFTRLVSGNEGFTPPGLLFGIMYAWYLDNSLASYIEYKMSVMKATRTDLIPEQLRTMEKRLNLITFFRDTVFGKEAVAISRWGKS